jgi:hypothetical protein
MGWLRGFQEVKVKVKQSRYRPGVVQRVPGSYVKGKAVPLQAWGGSEGSRKLR